MNLPKDPVMLLSFVNTQLRDNYSNLEELAAAYMIDSETIEEQLKKIDYKYDRNTNSFKWEIILWKHAVIFVHTMSMMTMMRNIIVL